MIGTSRVLACRLIGVAVSKPSIPGMTMSSRTTANSSACRACRACSPDRTGTRIWFSEDKIASSATRFSIRSSTRRIRACRDTGSPPSRATTTLSSYHHPLELPPPPASLRPSSHVLTWQSSPAAGAYRGSGGRSPSGSRGRHLRGERLTAQGAFDQADRTGGGGEPGALLAVGGEHGIDGVRWQRPGELGPGRAVSLARAVDTRCGVVPGHGGQRHRVASQDAVQPVVRRHHLEQPAHRGGLEILSVRRVHSGRPPWRRIRGHAAIIPANRTCILLHRQDSLLSAARDLTARDLTGRGQPVMGAGGKVERVRLTFVVGTGRCGSTMLSAILREHPDVLSMSEFFGTLRTALRGSRFPEGELDGRELWHLLASPFPMLDEMISSGLRIAELGRSEEHTSELQS